ncbi:MAG: hypothetical protein ACYSVY_28640, partial [Planctomycetota bacterium]
EAVLSGEQDISHLRDWESTSRGRELLPAGWGDCSDTAAPDQSRGAGTRPDTPAGGERGQDRYILRCLQS